MPSLVRRKIKGASKRFVARPGGARPRLRRVCLGHYAIVIFAIFTALPSADAQKILATVPVGSYGQAIGFNPVTHQIFTLDEPINEITEIDGRTFEKTVIPLGPTPEKSLNGDIQIDPVRNKVYASNVVSNKIAVIDVDTRSVKFVPAGTHPVALAINLKTNKIYAVNFDGNNVTVLDGATLQTKTIAVGVRPSGIAINSRTNTIYVTNCGSNTVSIIKGNNKVRTIPSGPYPNAVVVNRRTNRAYVANLGADTLTVIHGRSRHTRTLAVGVYPFFMVMNERTNKIYLNHQVATALTVVDGRTNAVAHLGSELIPSIGYGVLAVDEQRNKIYAGEWNDRVTIIDGVTNTLSSVPNPGNLAHKIAANPLANEFYTLNIARMAGNYPESSVSVFAGP
jgi:YVTN family beta-propeller protein